MSKRGGFWTGAERIAGNVGRVFAALRGAPIGTPSAASVFSDDETREEGEEQLSAVGAVSVIPTVYGCVDLLKTTVAKYPLRFYIGDPLGDREEVGREPGNIVSLFHSPNPWEDGFALVEKIAASLDLSGNAYLLLDQAGSMIRSMIALPAHRVEVKTGPNFTAAGYVLHYGGQQYRFKPDEIVHIRYWSPGGSPVGLAPMSAASLSYRTQRLSQRWMHSLYLRGGEGAGVYTSENGVAPAKRERLELKMKQRYRGPENAGRMLVLPPGVKREATMLTPEQMQLIASYKLGKADIYEVFGIPPWMKGLKEGSSLGSSGAEVDERMFTDNAIEPRHTRIARGLTHELLRFVHPDLHCEFDLSAAYCRRQVVAKIGEQAKTALGFSPYSVNEWRVLGGLAPSPDPKHDEIPTGPAMPAGAAPTDKGNAETDPNADGPDPQAASAGRHKGARAAAVPDAERARIDAELERHERRVARTWTGLFDAMELRLLAILDRTAGAAAAAGGQSRLTVEDHDLALALDLTPDERELLRNTLELVLATQGEAALAALGLKFEFSVVRAGGADFLRRLLDRELTATTETTRHELRERLAQVLETGGGLSELTAAVRDVFDHRRSNALTIARTETAPAYNFGTWAAWVQSGVVRGKTWVTIKDGNARHTHEQADGQTVPLVEKFVVGDSRLIYPGDPEGAAGEVINCRCGMIAVLAEVATTKSAVAWFESRNPKPSTNGHATNRIRGMLTNGA